MSYKAFHTGVTQQERSICLEILVHAGDYCVLEYLVST